MCFGTVYDYFAYQPALKSFPETETALESDVYKNQSWFVKVLLAFSVYTNGKAILKTEQRAGQGLMCSPQYISTHLYTGDNLVSTIFNFPLYFTNQVVLNAPLGVDTFFFVSGLLVTFLWLRATQRMKAKNIKSGWFWFNYYFHRYLRLTPVYMVVLVFHVTLLFYIADGPQWRQINAERCQDTWWLNPLYINNLVKSDDPYTCVGWSWYLANDMQFYVLCPILLILLWSYEWIGLALCSGILIAAGIAHSLIIKAGDFPPSPILTTKVDIILKIQDYWPDVYVKPWVRCAPYVVGVVVGYLLWKTKLKTNMKWYFTALGWALSWLFGLLTVFGLYNYSKTGDISDFSKYLFASCGRTAYAMSLGWLVFACATGHGGPINTLLSWKVWIPLSRLTYCAYLIHPIIIQAYMFSRKVPFHFGHHYQLLVHFFAISLLSYAVGFMMSLAFEVPVSHVESIVRTSFARPAAPAKAPPPPTANSEIINLQQAFKADALPTKGILKNDEEKMYLPSSNGDNGTTTTATVYTPTSQDDVPKKETLYT